MKLFSYNNVKDEVCTFCTTSSTKKNWKNTFRTLPPSPLLDQTGGPAPKLMALVESMMVPVRLVKSRFGWLAWSNYFIMTVLLLSKIGIFFLCKHHINQIVQQTEIKFSATGREITHFTLKKKKRKYNLRRRNWRNHWKSRKAFSISSL